MARDPWRYSTIRKEPAHKPADGYSMHGFYDLLAKPPAIVATLVGYLVVINRDLGPHFLGATQGDQLSIAHLLVLLLSLLAGLRVIQSLLLAKRDYAHLESGFFDLMIFISVLLFASGVIMRFDDLVLELSLYALCAFLGMVNFLRLLIKIPANDEEYDFPVERLIQTFNTIAFAFLTALLILAAYAVNRKDYLSLYWAVGASCALLVANIIHSEQLTMLPKFLFSNAPDSPSSSVRAFRAAFGHVVALKTDEEIASKIFENSGKDYRSIKAIRATRRDTEKICAELLQSFDYMFTYVFGTKDGARLKRTLRRFMNAARGCGALGYMNFYLIVNDTGEKIGFFKLETSRSNWLYQMRVLVKLPFILIFSLRTINLVGIWRRAKQALSNQLPPGPRELRLTYLLIYDQHRSQGYGQSFLRLLRNAAYNHTNDIVADRITLFVREKNLAARSLFEKAGFLESKNNLPSESDPFVHDKSSGRLLNMELKLSEGMEQQLSPAIGVVRHSRPGKERRKHAKP